MRIDVNHKIDVYLSRATSVVQIGLFVVTLLTLYFTVIPLYKSAQLEEALAKKELELDMLNKQISDLYIRVRTADVSNLVDEAVNCSGWRQLALGQAKDGASFSKDIAGCIDDVLNSYDLSRLKSVDRLVLKDLVSTIKLQAKEAQNKYWAKYDGYANQLRLDPSTALPEPEDHLSKKLDDLMQEIGVSIVISPEDELHRKLTHGKSAIELEYFQHVTSIIRGMSNVRWVD